MRYGGNRTNRTRCGAPVVTIYKSFIRPHLDYSNVIYDQPKDESFCSKIEQIQYNAALAITGAINTEWNKLDLDVCKSKS